MHAATERRLSAGLHRSEKIFRIYRIYGIYRGARPNESPWRREPPVTSVQVSGTPVKLAYAEVLRWRPVSDLAEPVSPAGQVTVNKQGEKYA